MLLRQFSLSALLVLLIFVIQESVISQFRLPGGGFSLLLIFSLTWASLSTPTVGALIGFIAGLMMDLSQSADGPLGQWTLILIIAGYVLAFLAYGDDSVRGNPISIVILVSLAVGASLALYLISGLLLGLKIGSISGVAVTLIGNSLWTLAITPLLLPAISYVHNFIFDSKARL
ncbi:unannotated protein [freshwater metagenome]|uniref:Unannotated protein n=1 Tax=freshwater metagenome TaxID=449393 RepID=A0A6J7XSA1_9ZZZZ|nr:rod shape-determining protein MreD [Actinomycetota bacterium]